MVVDSTNREEVINEFADPEMGLIIMAIAITGTMVAGVVGLAASAISENQKIKKAIELYPKIYKDCKSVDSLTRKLYTIKPFTDDPDKEMTDKEAKKAENWIHKYSMDKAVIFFDKDKPVLGYIYRSNTTSYGVEYSIKIKIFDKSFEKHKEYYYACFLKERKMNNKDMVKWAKSVLSVNDGKKPISSHVEESFFTEVNDDMEPVNEVFGLSKKEKEEKAANRKALSDLEFSYDKKFNAFCLSVSSYSVDKLQSMLDKKSAELESAKDEKKSASDRQKKLEAQVKIDYLENVCNRCKAMIKKKKSYEKK